MTDFATHPLMSRFWRRNGTRCAENNSLTLDDYVYTIRIDDGPTIELREERHCCYTSIISETRTFRGTWEAIAIRPDEVVLRLIGKDDRTSATEMYLVVTGKDIVYTAHCPA